MIFPQCEIKIPSANEILFVTGGRAPKLDWFRQISISRKIFAVDKGVEVCKSCEIIPEILIGDFDSAENVAIEWAKSKNILIERYPADKDFTDTQLALKIAEKFFGEHTAIITGAFGGRFDHLYNNIFTCANENRRIILADDREIIFYVKNGEQISVKLFNRPISVSLLPMTASCIGVSTKNLHWELSNATLTQDFPNATSNRADYENFSISINHGILATYLCFGEKNTYKFLS